MTSFNIRGDTQPASIWRGSGKQEDFEEWSEAIVRGLQRKGYDLALVNDWSRGDSTQREADSKAKLILLSYTMGAPFNTIKRLSSSMGM